jgi:glutaredoxin 3
LINNVEIYSKPDCPFCSRAKNVLNINNIKYTEQTLGTDFTREIILEKFPTAKTFPIIVVDGFYIGGYSQLVEKLNEQNSDTRKLLNE